MTDAPRPVVPPAPAPIPADAKKNLSGLDQLRGIRDGRFGVAPMQALMNMRLVEAEDGRVVFSGIPGEHHYNPVHRGRTIATAEGRLLDLAGKLIAHGSTTIMIFR